MPVNDENTARVSEFGSATITADELNPHTETDLKKENAIDDQPPANSEINEIFGGYLQTNASNVDHPTTDCESNTLALSAADDSLASNASTKLRSYQMRGNGWELFEYHNVWLTDLHVQAAKNLHGLTLDHTANASFVINSYPRSGTTWLKAAVAAMFSADPSAVLKESVHNIIPSIEDSGERIGVEAKPWRMLDTKEYSAEICHTHLPMSLWTPQFFTANVAVIYIYRNLKDTAVSNYHFMRSVQVGKPGIYTATINDLVEEIVAGQCWYGPYIHHVADAIKHGRSRFGSRFLLLNYDVIMQDQRKALVTIRNFILASIVDGADKSTNATSTQSHHHHTHVNLPHHSHFALHLHHHHHRDSNDGNGHAATQPPGMPINSVDDVLPVVAFDAMAASGANQMDNVPEVWDTSKGKFIRRAVVGGWRNELSEENGMKLECHVQETASRCGVPEDVASSL